MDKLITCPVCESDFCYEVEQEQKKLWHCFGCGFASNSNQHIETVDLEKTEAVIPVVCLFAKVIPITIASNAELPAPAGTV